MRHATHITVLIACSALALEVLAQDAGIASLPEDAGPSSPTTEDEKPPQLPADRAPSVKLTIDPKKASIGDPITWKAVVRRRVGDRVHLPSAADFGDLEVQNRDRQVGEPEDDWVDESLEITLLAFDTGEHEIPPQKLTVVDIEGRLAELETDAATVTVSSLIANEPEPELKPDTGPGEKVFEKDYTLLYILAVIGGIVMIALLTLLARWLWSKRKPRPGPPPPPPRPAEEIALEKLEFLKASGYLDEGRHKEYHVLLSETFREYLGNRYRFDSLELSTEEMTWQLRRLTLERQLFDQMVELLGETDLVKFAKYLPAIDESRRLLTEAFRLVGVTTPKKTNEKDGEVNEDDSGGSNA
ncbi:MAG: hypothetical protein JRF63_12690 [Deltaproteobacteria bacterium]|nr:hypothetical protein [Deltaproteobacteria bacterium]